MTLMERPIVNLMPVVNLMIESPSRADLMQALRPKFARLLQLDYPGWMRQLANDGFSDGDIKRLEDFIGDSFDETELTEKLASILTDVHDLNDDSQVDAALDKWLAHIRWMVIWEYVCQSDFPDPIDAAAYAGTYLLNIAASALAFESLRRNPARQGEDWSMDEADVVEGIELAESGLAEDAAEWPSY